MKKIGLLKMTVFILAADYVETLIKLPPAVSEEEKIRYYTIISITITLLSLSLSLSLSSHFIGTTVYVYYIIVEGQRGDDKSDEFAASLGLLKFLICQLVSRGAVCTAAEKSREQRLG